MQGTEGSTHKEVVQEAVAQDAKTLTPRSQSAVAVTLGCGTVIIARDAEGVVEGMGMYYGFKGQADICPFMEELAMRLVLRHQMTVRTLSPETFLEDLNKAGLIRLAAVN